VEITESGRPWTGVVKNRCKNGDYYWLLNNVAPFYENDQLVGYMSVRLKASQSKSKRQAMLTGFSAMAKRAI